MSAGQKREESGVSTSSARVIPRAVRPNSNLVGRHLPALQHQREVPRRDRRDDARGLVAGVGVVAGVHRQGLGRGQAGVVGEEPEVLGCARHVLAAGVADRLAHVAGVGEGEPLEVLDQQVGEAVDASRRARRSPSAATGPCRTPGAPRRWPGRPRPRRPARPSPTARGSTGRPSRTWRRRTPRGRR